MVAEGVGQVGGHRADQRLTGGGMALPPPDGQRPAPYRASATRYNRPSRDYLVALYAATPEILHN